MIYPTLESLEGAAVLQVAAAGQHLNSGDAVETDILIRDYDATNKAVPDVMAELLRYCGFVMVFFTDTDNDGIARDQPEDRPQGRAGRDDAEAPLPGRGRCVVARPGGEQRHVASPGPRLQPGRQPVAVETAPKQVEITVYLAPGFQPCERGRIRHRPRSSSRT